MQRSFNVYDPYSNERKLEPEYAQIQSLPQLERHAQKHMAIEATRRRGICPNTGVQNPELQAARKKNLIPFQCFAVRRVAPDALEKLDVRHWKLGAVAGDDSGLLDNQVMLWEADWRLATEEEELEAFKRNAEAKRAADQAAVEAKMHADSTLSTAIRNIASEKEAGEKGSESSAAINNGLLEQIIAENAAMREENARLMAKLISVSPDLGTDEAGQSAESSEPVLVGETSAPSKGKPGKAKAR